MSHQSYFDATAREQGEQHLETETLVMHILMEATSLEEAGPRILEAIVSCLECERAEAERLAEFDRLRHEFVASISHELLTPVTTLHGGLGMLEASLDDRMRPEERRLFNSTRRGAEQLRRLIDKFLALD